MRNPARKRRMRAEQAERDNSHEIAAQGVGDPAYAAWLDETVSRLRVLQGESLGHVLGDVFAWPGLQRSGTWVEFGVATGGTLRLLAAQKGEAKLVGFDSFEGLPRDWGRVTKGTFACKPPSVDGADLVVGRFEDTLPLWTPPSPVTLMHIDCDLYEGAWWALAYVLPMMVDGAVVAFDEFWNYAGWWEHEARALYEVTRGVRLDWRWAGAPRAVHNQRAGFVWHA